MRDLIVVGGGFWGVATATLAARRGLDVLLLDDSRPGSGSRAASGYLARSWWKTPEERARLERALDHMRESNVDVSWDGADVVGMDGRPLAPRTDWATFRPADLLAAHPATRAQVLRVGPGSVVTVEGEHRSRAVVLAAGVWTDDLLAASGLPTVGVTGQDGRGVLLSGAVLPRTLMRRFSPYQAWCVRPWGAGLLRAGETLETPKTATQRTGALLGAVLPLLPGARVVGELCGSRPTLRAGPLVRELVPGLVVATGGGRVGASLAWWAAETALSLHDAGRALK